LTENVFKFISAMEPFIKDVHTKSRKIDLPPPWASAEKFSGGTNGKKIEK